MLQLPTSSQDHVRLFLMGPGSPVGSYQQTTACGSLCWPSALERTKQALLFLALGPEGEQAKTQSLQTSTYVCSLLFSESPFGSSYRPQGLPTGGELPFSRQNPPG